MSDSQKKGVLPYGWIVQTSKHYKDRIYYFNINTGVSTWECPELDPPSSSKKENEKQNMEFLNRSSEESSITDNDCSISENKKHTKHRHSSAESKTPPTAVVIPVVHEHNSSRSKKVVAVVHEHNSSRSKKVVAVVHEHNSSGNKREQTKRKVMKEIVKDEPNKKKKSEKNVSSDDSVLSQDDTFTENVDSSFCLDSSQDIKDVEMRDVSMDLIDDLKAKKETLFDASASYYIVIDTNVLIRELSLISELKDTPLDGCGPPHIFIPWIVIEELDRLKNNRSIKGARSAAAEAIRYLNSVLSKHPRFHGQSPAESEEWSKSYSKNNDDKILECCVALMDKMPPEKVILLTNDKNLVNKALICKVNVHNFESMMKKVKPDTVFNYKEIINDRKKKKEKEKLESESPSVSIAPEVAEERMLRSTRDVVKREIHSLMVNARYLLKDVLYKFLEVEMFEAYGSVWVNFPIQTNLLKGILEGIKKYWRMVFSEFSSEKDQRNFELLLGKASRPEGYLGDKDDCLIILSTIEDVFKLIQKRRPTIRVNIDIIKEYRVSCVQAFAKYNEAESTARALEEKNILDLFETNWNAINQFTGLILDYYNQPNNLSYMKFNGFLPEAEVQRILITLYPEIDKLKKLMSNMLDAVKNCKPSRNCSKKLASALLQFIPALEVPYEPALYPFFNSKTLERFFSASQHRRKLECGIKQLQLFYELLDKVLCSVLRGEIKGPTEETMVCD